MIPYRLTPTSINVLLKGKTYTITEDSHQKYGEIREALKVGDFDLVEELINISRSIVTFSQGLIRVEDGVVYYDDFAVHNTLTQRILEMQAEGFDIKPMVAFLDNLMLNPSKRAVDELYGFLEACDLPITDDGHFVAYKKVNADYTDIYTGKISNAIGQVVTMRRNLVDEEKSRTCSAGLHFCSMSYLPYYGSSDPEHVRVVLVKINPADVVAIPIDYNNAKGRTCKYEVIGEVPVDDLDLGKNRVVYNTQDPDDPEFDEDFDDSETYKVEDDEFKVCFRTEPDGAYQLEYDYLDKDSALDMAEDLLEDDDVFSVCVINSETGATVYEAESLTWEESRPTVVDAQYTLEQRTAADAEYEYAGMDYDFDDLKNEIKAGVPSHIYSSRIVRCSDGQIMSESRNPAYRAPTAPHIPAANPADSTWPFPTGAAAKATKPVVKEAIQDTTLPSEVLLSKSQMASLIGGNSANFAAVDAAIRAGKVKSVMRDGFTWYTLIK